MTRTDVHAKSTSTRSARRRVSLRGLLALPAALALLAMLAVPALAAEPTSGYTHTATSQQEVKPSKTTSTPKSSTAPSKEKATPTTSVAPTTTTSTPVAKASSLPFTGLNLTWVVAFGLVLICAGSSIVLIQRRQRDGR
jgi:cytoskeletal protein RodZ